MIGQRFGRWIVETAVPRKADRHDRYRCHCDCGTNRVIYGGNLRQSKSTSCGCLHNELTAARNRVHGEAVRGKVSVEYQTWLGMIKRCEATTCRDYDRYGGRGIIVCARWRNSFPAFLKDMGRRPSNQYSIDRKDNSGSYTPSNCRWATSSEQAFNRRKKGG